MSSTFTDEQQDRIAKFLESENPAHLAGEDIDSFGNTGPSEHGVVSIQECAKWRKRVRNGDSSAAIRPEKNWSNGAVRDHAYGRCSHPDHAVGEPAESPGPGGPRHG